MHLRLLASPTCVGLRYGRSWCSLSGFSRVSTRDDSVRSCPLPSHSALGLVAQAYGVGRPSTEPLVLCSTVPKQFTTPGAGPECSPASHRLRLWGLGLGPASPCADCHGAGNLRLSVRGVFTRVCAYSFRHPHFPSLQPNVSTRPSLLRERSPTPAAKQQDQASAGRLIPTILGAFPLDW